MKNYKNNIQLNLQIFSIINNKSYFNIVNYFLFLLGYLF